MTCIVKNCINPQKTRTLCTTHYYNFMYMGADLGVEVPDPTPRQVLSAIGGKAKVPKGFALMPKAAVSAAGRKGGATSRRGLAKRKVAA